MHNTVITFARNKPFRNACIFSVIVLDALVDERTQLSWQDM